MSNRFYRLNIRFDLTDECQRLIAEKLQSFDRKQYGSINKFIIAAIGNTLDGRSSDTLTAEEVRSIIREEMRACFAEANFAPQPMTNAPALTAEQQEEAEQDIMDDLKLFD